MHLYNNQSGSVADFTCKFTFSINSKNNGNHADGIAWFITSLLLKVPDLQQGGGLGLASRDEILKSSIPFIAVEFDTYHNPWDDHENDHIGININSLKSVKSTRWFSSVLDGRVMEARISYHSKSENLCVSVTGVLENITFWQDDLCHEIDLRKYMPDWVYVGFTAATSVLFEIHTIRSWLFNSKLSTPATTPQTMTSSMSEHSSPLVTLLIALGVCLVIVLLVLAMIWLCISIVRARHRPEDAHGNRNQAEAFAMWNNGEARVNSLISRNNGSELELRIGATRFSHGTLARATEDFSTNSRIGEGGIAEVYRGYLEKENMYIAVKRFAHQNEWIKKEAATVSRLCHKNLVRFVGWCHKKKELLLVYEYVENGSLESHLYEEGLFLDWRARHRIVQGLASVLHYLQEELPCLVVHRDIKPRNVLLDGDFNVKLGGFELSEVIEDDMSSDLPIVGTFGYVDPHVIETGMPSRESDIFSFGVVVLEISCGRKPLRRGHLPISHWVWELYRTGDLIKAADPKLRGEFDTEVMIQLLLLGLWCAHPNIKARPSIREVINVLNFSAPLPSIPSGYPEPLNFPLQRDSTSAESSVRVPTTRGGRLQRRRAAAATT